MRGLRRLLVLVFALLVAPVGFAGTVVYYHNDLAGSPIAATNESGQVIWRESYRPHGERLTNDPEGMANKIWFTSRGQDAATGLIYMGARWYDPMVGRFVSTDPKRFDEQNLHSFSRYAYANNNPLKYVDPDGRMAIPLVSGAIIVGGGMYVLSPEQRASMGRSLVQGVQSLLGPLFNQSENEGEKGSSAPNGGQSAAGSDGKSKPDDQRDSATKGKEKDVPNRGEPGEVREGQRRTREYGPDGKPARDYDKPHQGHERPHVHEWENGIREHPGRDYSPLPRQGG